jgi:hypothetical protein
LQRCQRDLTITSSNVLKRQSKWLNLARMGSDVAKKVTRNRKLSYRWESVSQVESQWSASVYPRYLWWKMPEVICPDWSQAHALLAGSYLAQSGGLDEWGLDKMGHCPLYRGLSIPSVGRSYHCSCRIRFGPFCLLAIGPTSSRLILNLVEWWGIIGIIWEWSTYQVPGRDSHMCPQLPHVSVGMTLQLACWWDDTVGPVRCWVRIYRGHDGWIVNRTYGTNDYWGVVLL